MSEQTVARAGGSDVTLSGWTPAADRGDAPRPDAVRADAAQHPRPLPGTPRSPDAAAEPETDPVSREQSRESARDAVFPTTYARFAINPDTQRLSIKIVDAVTDEVIREIPPEQVQRIAEDLQSLTRHGTFGRRGAAGPGADGTTGGGVDRYV